MTTPRAQHPEIARIVDELRAAGGIITDAAVYSEDGALLAGRAPVDPRGTYTVSADSYLRMRAYAVAPEPELPRMPRGK